MDASLRSTLVRLRTLTAAAFVGAPLVAAPDAHGQVFLVDRVLASDAMDKEWHQQSFATAAGVDASGRAVITRLGYGVYFFERMPSDEWVEVDIVTPSVDAGTTFGEAAAIDGELAVAGMRIPGVAFVLRRMPDGSWTEDAALTGTNVDSTDFFAESLDISGDLAIVGSRGDDDIAGNSGAAFVFRRAAEGMWVEEAKLTASDAVGNGNFGRAVSIHGDRAIIGAFNPGAAPGGGAAYIFRRMPDGSWIEEDKLIQSDPVNGHQFGIAVSIHGDNALIGAQGDTMNAGAVYVFQRMPDGSWVENTKLVAQGRQSAEGFGRRVALDGPLAVISSLKNGGAAHFFGRTGGGAWVEQNLLHLSETNASFGGNVAVGGPFVLSLAGGHREADVAVGAAYFYDASFAAFASFSTDCNANGVYDLIDLFVSHTSLDCNGNGAPDECDIASGASLDANMNGVPDECEAADPGACPADLTGDGQINASDLAALLTSWGPCP